VLDESSTEVSMPWIGRVYRSDNGVPFASPNSLFNLSRLSVWLRLGITIERIQPPRNAVGSEKHALATPHGHLIA
jgi:hypothetical protein